MPKITKIDSTVPTIRKKKRVAAYARVSVEKDRSVHSLSAQISHYNDFIQGNSDWEFVGVYADSGFFATKAEGRDEFQRLISDCEKGLVDTILCKSISRFARNTVDLLDTVRKLKPLGVEVIFEKEGVNSMSADGEVLLSILASFAQEESRSLSENVKRGTANSSKRDFCPLDNFYKKAISPLTNTPPRSILYVSVGSKQCLPLDFNSYERTTGLNSGSLIF